MRRIVPVLFLAASLFFIFASYASAGEAFFVDSNYDWIARTQITATLHKESQHAYWYVEDEYWLSLSVGEQNSVTQAIEELGKEFDSTIYPGLINLLGDIWSPGIDNDPRVTILLTRLIETAGGYFNTNDEHPQSKISTSNEREMFYINARFITADRMKSFIAHEFQHLITYYQKNVLREVDDDIWLNETRSEVAPTLLGYDSPYAGGNLERRVSVFLSRPSDSLIEWRNLGPDYAVVNLFGQYLLDHYGKELFREILQTDKVGIASINEALARLGHRITFSDIFTNWTITNLINNCNVLPSNTYCYLNPNLNHENLHITFQDPYSSGGRITQVDSLKDWEAVWQEYTPGSGISKHVVEIGFISFVKDPVFRVPYVITKATGESEVAFVNLVSDETRGVSGKSYVEEFGKDVSRVVVILSNQTNVNPRDVQDISYTLTVELLEKRPLLVIPSYPDGSLLRASGEENVYVIRGNYKRWIPSADIFESYEHLNWEDIIEVGQEVLDYYQDSTLVRAEGDERVYEIERGAVKHWLRISGEEFSLSGREWGSVFIINERERDWYYPGVDIRA